jgi:hypothetical protein
MAVLTILVNAVACVGESGDCRAEAFAQGGKVWQALCVELAVDSFGEFGLAGLSRARARATDGDHSVRRCSPCSCSN